MLRAANAAPSIGFKTFVMISSSMIGQKGATLCYRRAEDWTALLQIPSRVREHLSWQSLKHAQPRKKIHFAAPEGTNLKLGGEFAL
jgi:hypothetical protein